MEILGTGCQGSSQAWFWAWGAQAPPNKNIAPKTK